jgi:sugar (pentulose or hexulose) kinase
VGWRYAEEFIRASRLPESFFPAIVPSTQIIGTLTAAAAEELGLPRSVKVACGGVDNSCMALGARNTGEGRVYTSLGSSSWIAVLMALLQFDIEPITNFPNGCFSCSLMESGRDSVFEMGIDVHSSNAQSVFSRGFNPHFSCNFRGCWKTA